MAKRVISIILLIALVASGIFIITRRNSFGAVPETEAAVSQTAAATEAVDGKPEDAAVQGPALIKAQNRFTSVGAIVIYAITFLLLLIIVVRNEKELKRRTDKVRSSLPSFMRNCREIRQAQWRYRLKRLPPLLIILALATALLFILPLSVTPEEAETRNREIISKWQFEQQAAEEPLPAEQSENTLSAAYAEISSDARDSSDLLKNLWWMIPSALVILLIMITRNSTGAKVFWCLCLIGVTVIPAVSMNAEWRTVQDMVFEKANGVYLDGEYQKAVDCYGDILSLEASGVKQYRLKHYNRDDIRNNQALALLQLGKNQEALAIMTDLCCGSKYPGEGYLLNLLAAAYGCGMTSDEILAQVPDLASNLQRLAKSAEKKPGNNARKRNYLAYNLVYMDTDGTDTDAGIQAAETLFQNDAAPELISQVDRVQNVLASIVKSNKTTYRYEDADVEDLQIYAEAVLGEGYIPQYRSAEEAENAL